MTKRSQDEANGLPEGLGTLELVEAAPDGTIVVDADGTMLLVNHQVERLLGFDREDLIGRPVEMLVPDSTRAGHVDRRAGYLSHPRARPMGASIRLQAVHRSGAAIPVEISLSPIVAGERTYVIASLRDVRERNTAEDALRDANEALAVADDRERIARDLHDTVIQRLFASGLSLQAVATAASGPVRDRVLAVVEDLDATIRELRTAVFGLKHRHELGSDVRNRVLGVIAEAAGPMGVTPRFRVHGIVGLVPAPIGDEIATVLREALSNVSRHADASDVIVSLDAGTDSVSLTIEDNGAGILPTAVPGNGLQNMHVRAERLGGQCEVSARPAGGTVVVWSVPYEHRSPP